MSKTAIIAHRGASYDAPENSLSAFDFAWKQGADGIEIDIRLTADGHIVCCHDATTARCADKDLDVATSIMLDLRSLDIGVRFGDVFRLERMPTFIEAALTVPKKKKIYVELKGGEELIGPLIQDVKKLSLAAQQYVFMCFDDKLCSILKEAFPESAIYWLCEIRMKNEADLLQKAVELAQYGQNLGFTGLNVKSDNLCPGFIQVVHEHGLECHAWTVDKKERAQELRKQGIDSITTNVPALIK